MNYCLVMSLYCLTAVTGNASIVEITTINSSSHRVDSEVVLIHIAALRNTAAIREWLSSSMTCDIPPFTDGCDDVIVHTFFPIHWGLETDHS